ncbi:isochorismatase family protein [Georgenia subflava]|uniref:isochorismatase family protein n=1 Tax=Georgenia subflava TaxID=1622177 RepID=UPI00186B3724|nr:isochorismatase family protein [Georgenia subflava]
MTTVLPDGRVDFSAILDERDAAVFAAAGYGERAGFGRKPVLVVIDVNHNFCGDRPEPILDSIRRWRNSCGEAAWEALPHVAALIDSARANGIPVIYSTGEDPRPDGLNSGRWADKNRRRAEDSEAHPAGVNEIMPQIAPEAGDVVIRKPKPSVFYASPLQSYLVELGADSLVLCGTTTSGCVRATVLDGFSNNYRMSVVAEATFDRGRVSHLVNLFDMDQKYADVVGVEATTAFFDGLPADLYRVPATKES